MKSFRPLSSIVIFITAFFFFKVAVISAQIVPIAGPDNPYPYNLDFPDTYIGETSYAFITFENSGDSDEVIDEIYAFDYYGALFTIKEVLEVSLDDNSTSPITEYPYTLVPSSLEPGGKQIKVTVSFTPEMISFCFMP